MYSIMSKNRENENLLKSKSRVYVGFNGWYRFL